MPAEFLATLPEDIRSEASLQTIPDVPTLAKSYVSAQKMIGQNRLPAPEAGWKPEQWDNFYKTLGRPEKPDGYKLADTVKFPDGMVIDDAKKARAFERFHKSGLLPNQVNDVMGFYAEVLTEASTAEATAKQQAHANGIAELKKEFGDKLDGVVAMAKAVISSSGDDAFTEFLETSGLANDPRMVRFLHKIAQAVGEDTLRGGRPIIPEGDSAMAQKKLDTLYADQEFMKAYNTRSHPGHADAVNMVLHLNRQITPGKVTA